MSEIKASRNNLPRLTLDNRWDPTPNDIHDLASPFKQISGFVISTCGYLAQKLAPGSESTYAVLSTQTMVIAASSHAHATSQLWRSELRASEYWTRRYWIIPMHCIIQSSGHWVLCVVDTKHRIIYLHDSLAIVSLQTTIIQVRDIVICSFFYRSDKPKCRT
jgi:hypothetical protein